MRYQKEEVEPQDDQIQKVPEGEEGNLRAVLERLIEGNAVDNSDGDDDDTTDNGAEKGSLNEDYRAIMQYAEKNGGYDFLKSVYLDRDIRREVMSQMDQSIVGQEHAKKILLNSTILFLKGIKNGYMSKYPNKHVINPILLIGPTGCGKSKTIEDIANISGLPYRRISMTSLSPRSYRGTNLHEALAGLWSDTFAETPGILHFDEFDKCVYPEGYRDVGMFRNELQKELLDIIEGKIIDVGKKDSDSSSRISANRVLIVFSGSFAAHIERIKGGYSVITNQTLIQYGLIPELAGRIGEIIQMQALRVEDYRTIIHNIIKKKSDLHLVKMLELDFKLNCDERFLEKLAVTAHESQCGARYITAFFDKKIREKCLDSEKVIELNEDDFELFFEGTKINPPVKSDYIL